MEYQKILTEKVLMEIFLKNFLETQITYIDGSPSPSFCEVMGNGIVEYLQENNPEIFNNKSVYFVEISVSGNFQEKTNYYLYEMEWNNYKRKFCVVADEIYLGTRQGIVKCERNNFPYLSCESKWIDGKDIKEEMILLLNHYEMEEKNPYKLSFFSKMFENIWEK